MFKKSQIIIGLLFLFLTSPLFIPLGAQAAILAPINVCHPVSGVANDLCIGAWARPGFTFISAQNGGGDQPQTTFFTVTDLTTPGSGIAQGLPVTTSAAGQNVNINSNNAISLISGHRYSWSARSFDPTLVNSGPASAAWTFNYDSTLPTYAIAPSLSACYTVPAQPTTVNVVANDLGTGASGVSQVWGRLDAQPEVLLPLVAAPNNYRYTFPVLTPGLHQLFIRVSDVAGNLSGPLPSGYQAVADVRFTYQATICTAPWIQTQQGDVHSNTGVNTPGGPL